MIKYANMTLAAALVAGAALSGCSADKNSAGTHDGELGAVSARLLVDNTGLSVSGRTTTVDYSLECEGEVVKDGTIPVPLDSSTASGFFGSVQPSPDCSLTLSTTVQLQDGVTLGPDEITEVDCSATEGPFAVDPGETTDLGTIEILCRVDQTGEVNFDAEIRLMDQSLDTFFVGPRLIENVGADRPPVSLSIATPLQDPPPDYSWRVEPSNGGSFVGCDSDPTDCEFFCDSDGTHTIVLSGNLGTVTLERSVDVTCVTGVVCGDGDVAGNEECDDGNTASGDGCSSTCVVEFCGDGTTNNGEECDDGNADDDDACGNDCLEPVCGDGELEGNEVCEAPFAANCDPSLCQIIGICGDGIVGNSAGEECDDGNNVDGDGCSASCTEENICNDCLSADPNVAPFNDACNDPTVWALGSCSEIRDCVASSNCYQLGKAPSDCYCGDGVDINVCSQASFDPTGSCEDEIRAAFPAGTSNADIAGGMAAPGLNASGDAFNILINSAAFGICVDECTLAP